MNKKEMTILRNQAMTVNSFMMYEDITMDENLSADTIRFTDVTIRIAHVGKNRNKSNFSKEILESMIPSLYRIPIVGYIEVGENNEEDFAGHEERYIIQNGEVTTEYLGRMYGFIPKENNARFEMVTVDGIEREYLVADGVLINKFSKMKEIMDRDEVKGHSMELLPDTFDGYYEKVNDQYVVTSADFEALCILGNSKIPAMAGGQIEKTQFTSIKFELQSLLQEMDLRYTSEKEAQKLNNEIEKGGNELDIKTLEALMTNYTLISDEFVEGIKSKLTTYETEEALKEILDAEQATQFALTAQAQMEILGREVKNFEVYTDRWGDERSRYYMRDINLETSEVYVTDRLDYSDAGFTFEKSGDSYEINAESRFNVAWQPVKLEEGSTAMNFSKEEISTEYDIAVTKVEEAKQEVATTFEATLLEQKTTFEKTISGLEEELSQLRTFKATEETKEKTEFVASVENLTDAEKLTFTEAVTEYTLDSLKLKVAEMIGLKSMKFTAREIESIKDTPAPLGDDNVVVKSYDHLMSK